MDDPFLKHIMARRVHSFKAESKYISGPLIEEFKKTKVGINYHYGGLPYFVENPVTEMAFECECETELRPGMMAIRGYHSAYETQPEATRLGWFAYRNCPHGWEAAIGRAMLHSGFSWGSPCLLLLQLKNPRIDNTRRVLTNVDLSVNYDSNEAKLIRVIRLRPTTALQRNIAPEYFG
jgi:hypothetical protein